MARCQHTELCPINSIRPTAIALLRMKWSNKDHCDSYLKKMCSLLAIPLSLRQASLSQNPRKQLCPDTSSVPAMQESHLDPPTHSYHIINPSSGESGGTNPLFSKNSFTSTSVITHNGGRRTYNSIMQYSQSTEFCHLHIYPASSCTNT